MANNFKKYQGNIDTSVVEARFKKSPFTVYNPVVPQDTTINNVANMQQSDLYNQQNLQPQQQTEEVQELLPSVITSEKEKEDKGNFLQRTRQTIKDYGTRLEIALLQGTENFVDWGVSLLGDIGAGAVQKLGDVYGEDELGVDNRYKTASRIREATENFIKRDFTEELTNSKLYNFSLDPSGDYSHGGNALEKIRKQSYISELRPDIQNYIIGSAEGIGQMLPAVATGGFGSLYLFGSAFGGSMSEALEQGASYEDAKTYGFLSGSTELALEFLSGGIGGIGKGLAEKALSKAAPKVMAKLSTNKIISFAGKAIGEGIEEVGSELLNPYLKRITFDPDAPNATNEEILQSFIIGSAVGAIMQGGAIVTTDYMSDAQEIDNLINLQMEAYKNGRYSDASSIAEMIQKKSDRLGSKLETEIDLTDTYASRKIETLSKIYEKADQQKYATASNNLQDSISEDLKKMSKESRQKFIQDNKVDYIFDREGNIKESYTKLTDKQKSDIVKINKLTKIDPNLKINYVTEAKNIQGYYSRNNNQITINLNAEDPYRFVGIHEFTHSLEGSKSYYNLRDFIVQNLKKQKKYASQYKKSRALYKSEFDKTSKAIDLKSKLQKGEMSQQDYYDTYNNMLRNYVEEEMVAKVISEDIFTDENTINELVGENESLGKRILKWINNKIKGTEPEFNAWRKELKTAKKLYQEAINEKKANEKETNRKDFIELDEQTKKIISNKYDTIKFSIKDYKNLYNTGEAKGTDVFDVSTTANGSYYNNIIPGAKENDYMRDNKNVVGKIEYMTPQKYYEKCVSDIFKRGTVETLKESRVRSPYKGYIDQLKEVITKKGLKYPMTFIDYANVTQEGLHRMMAVAELFGWNEVEFPVLVVDFYDKELQKKWDLKENIYDVKRWGKFDKYKYENYNELIEELEYEFEKYLDNGKEYNFKIEDDILYITQDGITVEEDLEDYNIVNREFEEDVKYSLKDKKPREPRVESTKDIPSDYVTGKAEAKQPLKYGRKSTVEIYEGLIDSIALETDEVFVKGGKDKVIDYIFQQINTNKLTVDRIAEKIVNYVMKNTLISNEKIPTDFRKELLNNFKADLQELATTKGKDTFRTKMFERINSLKEKMQQAKEKEALKKTVKNLKQFKKLEGMDFSYNNNVKNIANLLDSGITAFSKLDPEFIDSYKTRVAIKTFVELVERNNNIAIQREQFDRVFEIQKELLKEAKDIFNHKKIQSLQDLNSSELRTFEKLISLIKHTVNDYLDSKAKLSVFKANKRAKETIKQLDKAKNRPVTAISKVADKVIKLPILLKRLEGSSTGEAFGLTKYVIGPMQNAQTKEMQNIMYLAEDFNNFNKNHKKFNQKLLKDFFTFDFVDENGNVTKQHTITLGQAITIYELSQRDAAARHFMPNLNAKAKGINIYDKKGNLKANLLLDGKHIEDIYSKFDEETKEYIRITEDFFNEKARQLKIDTDNLYLGYTNVNEDFYFPISVDAEEMTLDFSRMRTSEYFENLFGQSFNQKVLDEANNALRLKSIDVLIADHISRLSKYNAYIVPATQIDRMMNTTINGEMLHTVIDRKQSGMYKKMRDWFSDIVQTKKIDDSEKALAFFRSTYATSVLGFNAKSTITQLTAYPLAFKYISLKNLSKGAFSKMFSKEEFDLMDEYCPYVKYRNFESSVVVQEANLKTLNSVQKVVMAPITFADRYTIGRIWRAVQFEVEETTGYKIGTEENLKMSGKMLEKIIRDSQAVDALEQPEIQRNKKGLNEFLLMFTKQSTQMLNSVVGSIYEYQSIQQRIKIEGETQELIKVRDKAKKQLQRSVAGTAMSIISATLITYLISNLFLGKDDEEKEDWKEILIELGSNTVGMFPYMNQIYSLFQGYDLNISLFTSIENLTSAFETIPMMLKRGEYRGVWHKFSTAIAPFMGVPFKNINELGVGILNLFNPDLAYEYRSIWYNKSVSKYTADFDKALKNKNKKTAGNILLEIYKEKNIDLNEELTSKLLPLFMSSEVENKASLFPKTANQTVTFDSEEYEMSDKQYRQFKKLYSQNLNKYIKSVTSNSRYTQLSAAEKAQAIKYMQDYAYFTALSKTLNINTIEATKVTLLGNAINPVLIATILAKCRGSLKGKKAEIQRYINSIPGITREQKYLLYGMLGYKPLQDNAYVQVSNYLSTKGYSIQEIHTILVKCKFIEDDEE